MTTRLASPIFMLALSLCGCDMSPHATAHHPEVEGPDVTVIPEDQDALSTRNDGETETDPIARWVGRWAGPEGLFLDIEPRAGEANGYALTIKDTLDTQGKYIGTARGDAIHFTRRGTDQTIRAGAGNDTGFKYLAGKEDCLIIVPGQEGYCRD